MRGKRVRALRRSYRDPGLSLVDRQPRTCGGKSNLRRRLKQFWKQFGHIPASRGEMVQFDHGMPLKRRNAEAA